LVAKLAGLGSKGCHFLDLVAFDQKKSLTFEAHALAILQDGAKGRSAIFWTGDKNADGKLALTSP